MVSKESDLEKMIKKDVSRLRSEVYKLNKAKTDLNPAFGLLSGQYYTESGIPWAETNAGRKAVITEWFWQPYQGATEARRHK